MIKAVLFDFGGVLSEGGRSFLSVLAKVYDVDPEKIKFPELQQQFRTGEITAEHFFDELNKHFNASVTVDDLMHQSDIFSKSQPVYDLAESLRAHGVKTGILSNVMHESAYELRKRGFYEGFDPLLLSCDVGLAKPETKFYQMALDKLQAKGNEVIFVDDQEKCWPPAEALGMHVVKAESAQQIVGDVKKLLKSQNNLTL